jgi:hypothetical protein
MSPEQPLQPHPYVTAVEIPEDIAQDHHKAAEYGFIEWFRRADEIGFTPHIVAGSCHLKLHMRVADGKHWLHVSGPVTDPPGQGQAHG